MGGWPPPNDPYAPAPGPYSPAPGPYGPDPYAPAGPGYPGPDPYYGGYGAPPGYAPYGPPGTYPPGYAPAAPPPPKQPRGHVLRIVGIVVVVLVVVIVLFLVPFPKGSASGDVAMVDNGSNEGVGSSTLNVSWAGTDALSWTTNPSSGEAGIVVISGTCVLLQETAGGCLYDLTDDVNIVTYADASGSGASTGSVTFTSTSGMEITIVAVEYTGFTSGAQVQVTDAVSGPLL